MKFYVFSQALHVYCICGEAQNDDLKVCPQIINHPENKEIILHIMFIFKKIKRRYLFKN